MEWLCVIRPTRIAMLTEGMAEEEAQHMSNHYERLRAATEAGTVVLAGPSLLTDDRNVGVIVFRADSQEDAQRFVDADPAVAHGVMTAELHPFRISLLAAKSSQPAGSSASPAQRNS